MLDRFVYGKVDRTSPEAPVPILDICRSATMLGGVGNVARNLISMGASATLLSVVGDDEVGRNLTQMIGRETRLEPHLLVELQRPSTEKTRFVAESQQLLRTDTETSAYISKHSELSILQMARDIIPTIDVLVLSDYGKGVLTNSLCNSLIDCARTNSKPIVVDPKGNDYTRYRGATLITPNKRELALAIGADISNDEELVSYGRSLINEVDINAILVTRSQDGMTLIWKNGKSKNFKARAREVFDVSGAGDTVVATIASAMATGLDLSDAAALANAAAGIAVAKSGTAVVYATDLLHALRKTELSSSDSKILLKAASTEIIERWRLDDLKIGFTNGCFDLLHPGHLALLTEAKSHCDRLIIGLNSDASVKKIKGQNRPIQSESARAQVLASLEATDLVIIFSTPTPIDLIKSIKPDFLIKGGDYAVDQIVGAEFVQEYGGQVVIADLKPGYSTSGTIEKLQN